MDSSLNLLINISAMDMASSVIRSVAGTLGPVGDILATAAIATIGLGAASIKAAGDFQQAILSDVAHAGLAKDQVNNVSNAIMGMSVAVGRSPTELAEALYPILSGFSGISNQAVKTKISLATLQDSFEAVAGTTVNGTSVANAAIGTFNALGLATNNAATNQQRMTGLFDIMDKTVQEGNMTWDAYRMVVSKLAVSIQGTGISFNEASSALATLTNEGYTARQAQTYLSNMFVTMAIKTDALATHAKKLGISFDETKYSSMTLAQKIAYLNDITDGNKQKLLALMGNNATALRSFNALSAGLGSYKNNLQAISHAHGTLAQSFATASSGFNQSMNRMKAAGQVVLITIGQALLPIVTKLVNQVTPLITQFATWLTKSGILKEVANALAGALQWVVGAIVHLVAIGVQVYNFFLHNTTAMNALKAVLVAVGTIILISMVTAFVSWAIAAGSAAIATIAATWPLIALAAVIALVVFGVIEAVQHWGAIVKFFEGLWKTVWGAVSSFFVGIWTSVVGFFEGVFARFKGVFIALGIIMAIVFSPLIIAIAALAAPFVGLYLLFTHFHQVMQLTQRIAEIVWQGILNAILAPIHLIGAAFEWLYQHNTYFQRLVDAIRNILTAGIAWIRGIWESVIGWIVSRWDYLKAMATIRFMMLYVEIKYHIQLVENFIHSIWEAIVGYLQGRWQAVVNLATSLWAKVTGVFQAAWSGISGALHSLWDDIVNFVSGWPSQALQWGINLIQGLINGITSMAGNVEKTVSGIAGNIAKFLGFHSPAKEGPGSHLMEWGPGLVTGFSESLLSALPTLQAALNKLTLPIQAALSVHGASALSVPMSGIPLAGTSAAGGGPMTMNATITLNFARPPRNSNELRELAEDLVEEMGHQFRMQTPGWSQGGYQ